MQTNKLMLLFALTVLPACTVTASQSGVPIIDSVAYPPSVDSNADGSYDIDITIDFHDSVEEVDTVHLDSLSDPGVNGDFAITPTLSGSANIHVILPSGTEDGTIQSFEFYVDLVSISNVVSANSVQDTIDLCPINAPGC